MTHLSSLATPKVHRCHLSQCGKMLELRWTLDRYGDGKRDSASAHSFNSSSSVLLSIETPGGYRSQRS
jgi:hypothetical protein